MGLAAKVRAAGLRADVPMDVYIVAGARTSRRCCTCRIRRSTRRGARSTPCNDGTHAARAVPADLAVHARAAAEGRGREACRACRTYGCEFLSLDAGCDGRHDAAPSTARPDIRAQYLVGCDGGGSAVRQQLGIALRGEGDILRLRQALYRCDELFDRIPIGAGPGTGPPLPRRRRAQATFLIMQDSTRHWTLHAVVDERPQTWRRSSSGPSACR